MTEIPPPPPPVEVLILGAGWTSTFLIPLLVARGITHFATHRADFAFDPASTDPTPFRALPAARTVLITFPIKVDGGSTRLVQLYRDTHPGAGQVLFVQLGSTGIYDGSPTVTTPDAVWKDRHSAYDTSNARAQAEAELLTLSTSSTPTTILNLCGLWGGPRDPRHWVSRVAPSKDALAGKRSIHMIHGADVARAILAVHDAPDKARGERWLITDARVYDWWDLAGAWGKGDEPRWVRELMAEHGVRALPRAPEVLGKALDGREFWDVFGLEPTRARLEKD